MKSIKTSSALLSGLMPVIFLLILSGCSDEEKKLPYLGKTHFENGKAVYPVIADFSFLDQDGRVVTNSTFKNKIYVADFFFTSCPTICPRMAVEMKKTYQAYADDTRVSFLSHTIDPEHDTREKLKQYAEHLEVDGNKWLFVTGKKEEIYSIAVNSYFSAAFADSSAPGGYVHSGGLLLIDTNRHIRGVYDGTDPVETERLTSDIAVLLKEEFKD